MVTKTKINKSSLLLSNIPSQLSILLMTLLTTLSGLDINSNHIRSQIALPNRPALAFQEENSDVNSMRRESEETAPHYISYSVTQRTPSRSSKH